MNIRKVLEKAVKDYDNAFPTAYENVEFIPVKGKPYQQLFIIKSVVNNEISRNFQYEGILQLNLVYPINDGSAAIETRANGIQSYFYRGNTFYDNVTSITITNTPNIEQGYRTDSYWIVPIVIKWFAQNR